MDKINFSYPGKFPTTQDSLDFMQIDLQRNHTALAEAIITQSSGHRYLILSGCQQNGANVSAGMVIVDGEIMPCAGGAGDYVKVVETKESVAYLSGQVWPAYIKRVLEFGDGAGSMLWSNFKTVQPGESTKIGELRTTTAATGNVFGYSYLPCGGNMVELVKYPDLKLPFVPSFVGPTIRSASTGLTIYYQAIKIKGVIIVVGLTGVSISKDDGVTWKKVFTTTSYCSGIAATPDGEKVVVVGTNVIASASTDNLENWSSLKVSDNIHVGVVYCEEYDCFAAVSGQRVYSIDYYNLSYSASEPYMGIYFVAIEADSNGSVIIAGRKTGTGIETPVLYHYTADDLNDLGNFGDISSITATNPAKFVFHGGSYYFFLTKSGNEKSTIYRSDDGANWKPIAGAQNIYASLVFKGQNDALMFLAQNNYLYYLAPNDKIQRVLPGGWLSRQGALCNISEDTDGKKWLYFQNLSDLLYIEQNLGILPEIPNTYIRVK